MSIRKQLYKIFPRRAKVMASSQGGKDPFTLLPPEIVELVFSFCRPVSLAQLRSTCRHVKVCVDSYIEHLPLSAEMVRSRSGGLAQDGEYNIAVRTARFGLVPLRVFCHDMAGKPREFITLEHRNYSQLKAGGTARGRDILTTFRKVRLLLHSDPKQPMYIACCDFTFADSEGDISMGHGNGTLTTLFDSMPYGTVMNSGGPDSHAQIDLRGTGLAVDCKFRSFGCGHGCSNVSGNGQLVAINGGGYPGGCGPRSALDAHHTTMNFGPDPFAAKRAWDIAPVVIRVEIAGGKKMKDYKLSTALGNQSWNDGARD